MYDSLLDELEDDVVARPREVEELNDKVAEAEEAEAILDHDTTESDLSTPDDGNQLSASGQSSSPSKANEIADENEAEDALAEADAAAVDEGADQGGDDAGEDGEEEE